MFPYKPQLLNKQLRIIIAACLAITAHVGLISLTVEPEIDIGPGLSLPRSVNVFLGQGNTSSPVEMTDSVPQEEMKIEKHPVPDSLKTDEPVTEQAPASPEPAGQTQKALQVVEKSPPVKKTEIPAEVLAPQPLEPVARQDDSSQPRSTFETGKKEIIPGNDRLTTAAENQSPEGVSLPGTLQMAYPRYHLNSPPPYPGLARKRGQQGTVVLKVLVNSEGRVEDMIIDESSGFSLLDRAAVKAVGKWLFEPGKKQAENVSMWVKVPVTFTLKGK